MVPNCATAEDLLRAIKDEKVQMIDLRFTDLPGVWQHFSIPPSAVSIDALDEGIGFDGSSIRGFQEIQESDMARIGETSVVKARLSSRWAPSASLASCAAVSAARSTISAWA